ESGQARISDILVRAWQLPDEVRTDQFRHVRGLRQWSRVQGGAPVVRNRQWVTCSAGGAPVVQNRSAASTTSHTQYASELPERQQVSALTRRLCVMAAD